MNVLLVEDEVPAQLRLKQLFALLPAYRVCGLATHGEQALELNALHQPDIVLLDIHLPGLDGLATAHRLAQLPHPPALIFTTAYEEHALAAFSVRAAGYLLKPIRLERLVDALDAAQQRNRAQQLAAIGDSMQREDHREVDFFISQSLRKITRIPLAQVIYFNADQKYTALRHGDGAELIDESLKQIELHYPQQFLRIHRSSLIAPAFAKGLIRRGDGVFLQFHGIPDALEISRRHLSQVKALLRLE